MENNISSRMHKSIYKIHKLIKNKNQYPSNKKNVIPPEQHFSAPFYQNFQNEQNDSDMENIINAIQWIDQCSNHKKQYIADCHSNFDFSMIDDENYVKQWISSFFHKFVQKWFSMNGINMNYLGIICEHTFQKKFQSLVYYIVSNHSKYDSNSLDLKTLNEKQIPPIFIDPSFSFSKISDMFDQLEISLNKHRNKKCVSVLWIHIQKEQHKQYVHNLHQELLKQIHHCPLYIIAIHLDQCLLKSNTIRTRWSTWKKSIKTVYLEDKFDFFEIILNNNQTPYYNPIFEASILKGLWIDATYLSSLFVKSKKDILMDDDPSLIVRHDSKPVINIVKIVNRLSHRLSIRGLSDIANDFKQETINQIFKNDKIKIAFAPEYNRQLCSIIEKKGFFFSFIYSFF